PGHLRRANFPQGVSKMKLVSYLGLGALALLLATASRAASAADEAAKPGATKPGAAGAPAAGAPAPRGKSDREHMTLHHKKKYMKTAVLPEMKKAFQEFDAKTFKKFNCDTCHGDGVADGKFKMPNPKLPKLPKPTAQSDFMELQKKKPEMVKFMGTV